MTDEKIITDDGIKTDCFACKKKNGKYLCDALSGWYSPDRHNKCYRCAFYKTEKE